MDAVKFVKEKLRMCTKDTTCIDCLIYEAKGDRACSLWVEENPEKAVAIVAKWSEEHPEKTILEDFLEKYPNAKKYDTGEPRTCCNLLYGLDRCPVDDCLKCWNRPLSEVE